MFELGIRFYDGVRAYDQFFGKGSNARQLVSISQGAGFNAMADLLRQLQIEGLAGIGGDFEEHVRTVLLLGYRETVNRSRSLRKSRRYTGASASCPRTQARIILKRRC